MRGFFLCWSVVTEGGVCEADVADIILWVSLVYQVLFHDRVCWMFQNNGVGLLESDVECLHQAAKVSNFFETPSPIPPIICMDRNNLSDRA